MKIFLHRLPISRLQFSYHKKISRYFFSTKQTITSSSILGPGSLYKRISPVGDPGVSVVPVLDQWVQEGRSVSKEELQLIIKELRVYKRFKHALEISQWMSDKRYIPFSPRDFATRLFLIYRVHGVEQMENYFNNISQQFKGLDVYTILLSCYAHDYSVEKAEVVMQKLRDMGYATTPLSYNILMNLYYRMGSWEKLDVLMHEMEEKGIIFDNYTFSIRLSAYASASNSEGIDKIVTSMESDPRIIMDWNTYAVAAKGYWKVGLVEKALAMLNKLEGLITTTKRRNVAFDFLLRFYAETGNKDELLRIWILFKSREKIYNKGYISMMSSLLKLNDIEGAEKLFEEWESQGLSYDFRIPDFLIEVYCSNGLLGKAEALVNRGIAKGGDPSVKTWCYLAGGYIQDNQIARAIETLKKALLVCPPNWKPSKDTLAACLEHLEKQGEEEAEEFISLLKAEGFFSAVVEERLQNLVKDRKSQS